MHLCVRPSFIVFVWFFLCIMQRGLWDICFTRLWPCKVVIYLFTKGSSHFALICSEQKGSRDGDNVTGLSRGKVIYCSQSADSTRQDTSCPVMLGACQWWCSSISPRTTERVKRMYGPASQTFRSFGRETDIKQNIHTAERKLSTRVGAPWPYSLWGFLSSHVFWSEMKM